MTGAGARRRARPWLASALVGAVGLVETVVFAIQGRFGSAAVALVLLGFVAWLLSPAAFPGTTPHPRPGDAPDDSAGGVVVYWRPGCVYCLRLRWSLGLRARRAAWVDIWADEEAAAFVRGVNDGNETVPTVVIDGVPHTNPEVAAVRHALSGH